MDIEQEDRLIELVEEINESLKQIAKNLSKK